MSRIGKKPIAVPSSIQVQISNGMVEVKGPKGTLKRAIHPDVELKQQDGFINVHPLKTDRKTVAFQGLVRSLVFNMVHGVEKGYTKELLLEGVGYRAAVAGKDLNLTLGYSHPIVYKIPEGLEIKVDKQTKISVSGADKEQVGQAAADIRAYRKPEPYHGKGVRYKDEVIMRKDGKSGAKK